MTDPTARKDNAPPSPEPKAADEPASASPATPAAEPAPSTALDRELADMKDRLLRTLAEMENLRRRTEREVADARTYGIANFARDMLSVADNMERALGAPEVKELAQAEGPVKALVEGIELTGRGLAGSLEKHGVTRIEPLGERFDPNRHQAMYEVPDPSVPSGQIVQVVQAGYLIGERVLRPALVAVAKGGPKMAASGAGEAAAASANDNPAAD